MTLRIPLAAMLTVDAVGSHFDSMSLAELELCVEEDLPSKNHDRGGDSKLFPHLDLLGVMRRRFSFLFLNPYALLKQISFQKFNFPACNVITLVIL